MIRKQQSKNKYDEIKKKVFLKNYLIMCWILRYFTESNVLFFTYILPGSQYSQILQACERFFREID